MIESRKVSSLEDVAFREADLFFLLERRWPTELRGHPKTIEVMVQQTKLKDDPDDGREREVVFWAGPEAMKVIEDEDLPEGLWVCR